MDGLDTAARPGDQGRRRDSSGAVGDTFLAADQNPLHMDDLAQAAADIYRVPWVHAMCPDFDDLTAAGGAGMKIVGDKAALGEKLEDARGYAGLGICGYRKARGDGV
jgi:hypothetical protein